MARSAGGKKKETQLSRRKFGSCESSGLRKFTLHKPFHWDHKTKADLQLKQVWKGLNNTGMHYAAVIDRQGSLSFFLNDTKPRNVCSRKISKSSSFKAHIPCTLVHYKEEPKKMALHILLQTSFKKKKNSSSST